jgi:hypothetical protein
MRGLPWVCQPFLDGDAPSDVFPLGGEAATSRTQATQRVGRAKLSRSVTAFSEFSPAGDREAGCMESFCLPLVLCLCVRVLVHTFPPEAAMRGRRCSRGEVADGKRAGEGGRDRERE